MSRCRPSSRRAVPGSGSSCGNPSRPCATSIKFSPVRTPVSRPGRLLLPGVEEHILAHEGRRGESSLSACRRTVCSGCEARQPAPAGPAPYPPQVRRSCRAKACRLSAGFSRIPDTARRRVNLMLLRSWSSAFPRQETDEESPNDDSAVRPSGGCDSGEGLRGWRGPSTPTAPDPPRPTTVAVRSATAELTAVGATERHGRGSGRQIRLGDALTAGVAEIAATAGRHRDGSTGREPMKIRMARRQVGCQVVVAHPGRAGAPVVH